MMNLWPVIGIGITAAVLGVLLRQYRPEYAVFVSLAAGVVILFLVCTSIIPVVEHIQAILDMSSMPGEYAGVLFKALGICLLTQVACDTCKDAGESAIAAKVELAGKVAVLVISLPLFQQVLAVVHSLLV